MVSLDPDASKALQVFSEEIERRLRKTGDLRSLKAWGAKLLGNTNRVALVIHSAEQIGAGRHAAAGSISKDTIEKAISIARFLIEHAKAAFDLMAEDRTVTGAKRILEWAQSFKYTSFPFHQVKRKHRGFFKHKAAPLRASLAMLIEYDFIRLKPGSKNIYLVSPFARAAFAHAA
jgi:putative DNA primase/helicase